MPVRKPLRGAVFLGLGIFLVLLGLLIAVSRYSGLSIFPIRDAGEGDFYRKLREYDAAYNSTAQNSAAILPPEQLNRLLDDLEKSALGVESHLSTLKRRRALALRFPARSPEQARYLGLYREAALRAAAFFPFSQPLAAVAAEGIIRSGGAVAAARDYAALLSDPALLPLSLSVYILADDMENPEQAASIPQVRKRLAAFTERIRKEGYNGAALGVDAAILALLAGDLREAANLVRELPASSATERGVRFAAEFTYDFGNPERAAELFSRLPGTEGIIRQADALWLSDRREAARNLWTVLVSPDAALQGAEAASLSPGQKRGLYNLAMTSGGNEKKAALERLLAADSGHLQGVIAYSRLLDPVSAVAFLDSTGLPERNGLADLERLRRRQEIVSIDRMIGETWLVLGRHPGERELYQWAAYYFDRQKRYAETAQLLRTAGYYSIDEPWMALHASLGLMRAGNYNEAETLLRGIGGQAWQVPANIGRILEAKRSNAEALDSYEIAASLVRDNRDAARVQLRIARCLRALGRDRESRRVLEYAKSLDGENPLIRLELERLEAYPEEF
jgi:hypothetical protein